MASLIGSGCASIWFGMTSTYSGLGGAIIARGVIGGWNSIVGVTKTLATELAYHDFGDESHQDDEHNDQHKQETRIVGLIMSMRAWGYLVAPAMAGYLADPLMVRENKLGHDVQSNSNEVFTQLLQSFPYLLPNLLGTILCWLTAIAVFSIVPETLENCQSIKFTRAPCKRKCAQSTQQSIYISGTYGSLENVCDDEDENDNTNCCWDRNEESNETSIRSIWSRRNTRNHLIAYWLYSFVVISIDEAFPLFCIARNNGLGQFSESDIGAILSIAGLIFAIGQFHTYSWIVDRFGVYGSLSFGCWAGVLPISLIPCAALIAHYGNQIGVEIYTAVLMGLAKIFQSAFFSGITVATNRTVPKEMRSSMNGFGGVGAGAAKALGPILAGYWMARCLSHDIDGKTYYGSVLAFVGLSCLSLPIARILHFLEQS